MSNTPSMETQDNNYGSLQFNLEAILKERKISKNKLCKDLDIPRTNLNKYCTNRFQRIDVKFICKLITYLEIELNDLFTYIPKSNE